eukprot:GILJ01002998.1.p1 GENE.GILJ01002998.1~~GILJ01002998.1.p1  ORF type:complete len:335 (+),score=34.96 GILJ01002998.1:25-1029(+)
MRGLTLLLFLVVHVLPALLYEVDTDVSHDIAFPSSPTSLLQLSSIKSHTKSKRLKKSGRLRHKSTATVRKHKESSKKPLWGKAKKPSKLQRRLRHPRANKKTSHPQLSMAPSFAEQSSSFGQPVNSYPAPPASSPPASETSLAREYADALFRQTATLQAWQPNSYAAYASPFSHTQQQPFSQVPSSFFPPTMPSMSPMSPPSSFMQPPPPWMSQSNLPLQIPLPDIRNNMPYVSNDTISHLDLPSSTLTNNIEAFSNMNTMLRLAEQQQQGQQQGQNEGQVSEQAGVGRYEHLLDQYRVTSLHLPPSMPLQGTLPPSPPSDVTVQRSMRDNNKR